MGRSYGKATRSIANDPDDWEDLDRLDRIELYADDRDDGVNFEKIVWKSSQTTVTIERSIAVPEIITFILAIGNLLGLGVA